MVGDDPSEKKYEYIEDIPGVGPATAAKLRELGFSTIESLATATVRELAVAGIGEKQAERIIGEARGSISLNFVRVDELLKARENVLRLTTGSKSLDGLLGGGLETQTITEFYGEYGSGKCVSKDTIVIYFNSEQLHMQPMETVYARYQEKFGERRLDEGFAVPISGVSVIAYDGLRFRTVPAKYLYRERVKWLRQVKTERGRVLRLTRIHKLPTVNEEGKITWIEAGRLKAGDPIAVPRSFDVPCVDAGLSEDDAYFFGFFVAEGTRNPLSITTKESRIVEWIRGYTLSKFGFTPTVRERKETYLILLRKRVADWLGGLANSTAETKYVPNEILQAPPGVVKAFLAGYLEGDGHLSKAVEFTTKSERLSTELSYLLARIGVQVTRSEKVDRRTGNKYVRLFIVGNDRLLIRDLPYRLKSYQIEPFTSFYGYPLQIAGCLQKTFKKIIGSNRGRMPKKITKEYRGKTFGDVLTHTHWKTRRHVMNERTLRRIEELFEDALARLEQTGALLKASRPMSGASFREIYENVPFPVRPLLVSKLGMSKSAIGNYIQRGLPKDEAKIERIRRALLEEIDLRIACAKEALQRISSLQNFAWDYVDKIEELRYDDYVYDFHVPQGNTFIGGDLPTLLHNSQICHQLCVNVQFPSDGGGLEGGALYIDTENTFRTERLAQMAAHVDLDPEAVAKRIIYAEAYNSDHQILLLEQADKVIKENNIRLIIVDSLTAHFRSEYIGRESLAERQQKLNKHMHKLIRLARAFNAVAVVTNQVMAKPDQFFGPSVEAVGGHIVAHTSHTRIFLRKTASGPVRIGRLVSSPYLPEGERVFKITENGIEDVSEEEAQRRPGR